MNVYPYKTLKAGKFTKYQIGIAENRSVLVEYYFKNKLKSRLLFESQKEIKSSNLPNYIKEAARWAVFESKTIGGLLI